MTRVAATVAALGLAAATVIAAVLIWDTALGLTGGPAWSAEFTDARGIVVGNDVRVGGAVVGRVSGISLSRSGTALVRFTLSVRRAFPRVDAAAAIRPADLLGDNYLSLSPGTARAPLRGPITTADTVNAPRLDEVLDAFRPDVRDGLQTLLVEGGIALDDRGDDLARAIVDLRPALVAADGVLTELDSQNVALARLLPSAESAAGQLDAQRDDLGPLLDGLARTLTATAANAGELDRTVTGLPRTLSQLRATASRVSTLALTATPPAQTLDGVATPLGAALQGLAPLLDRVRRGAPGLTDAVNAARTALVDGAPGLAQLAKALPILRGQAPQIVALLGELDKAAPGIAQGFLVDFPDEAAEPGNQPLDPFADPTRNYWRGAAVLSCQTFGVVDAPGCLTKAIANLSAAAPQPLQQAAAKTRSAPPTETTPSEANPPAPGATAPQTPTRAPATTPASTTPTPTAPAPSPPQNPVSRLLNFLLGP